MIFCYNDRVGIPCTPADIEIRWFSFGEKSFSFTQDKAIRYLAKMLSNKVIEKQLTGTGAIKRRIPLSKPKREINKYYKQTTYNENKLLIWRAAIFQKVATQQPKLNLK